MKLLLNIAIAALLPGWFVSARAQDTLHLETCLQLVVQGAPRAADRDLLQSIAELKIENAGTAWMPSLNLNGKASYQSDVVEVALDGLPFEVDFPDAPHDQYGLNLDVQQTLYDGGLVRSRKEVEAARLAADLQKVEVDLHGLKSQLLSYYFGVLLLQERLGNLDVMRSNLENRRSMMRTAVEEGAMLASELTVIDVELLKLDQSEAELHAGVRTYLQALSILCDTTMGEATVLAVPGTLLDERAVPGQGGQGPSRPEYRWFELQDASLEAGKDLLARKRMPLVYAYGQMGYGQPGYNMLSTEWDTYYMLGAGLKWNIWDWKHSRREQTQISERQRMLGNQRAQFDQQLALGVSREEIIIARLEKNLQTDRELLRLQGELVSTAALQLEEGIITATDYVEALNKENMARIASDTRRVQLLQARANLLTIMGEL